MSNGYVIYPSGRAAQTLQLARQIAKEESLMGYNQYFARIEACDTNKTIALYFAGRAL